MKLVIRAQGYVEVIFSQNVAIESVSEYVQRVCRDVLAWDFKQCTFYLGEMGSSHPLLKPLPPSSRGRLPTLIDEEVDELVVFIEPPQFKAETAGAALLASARFYETPLRCGGIYQRAMRIIHGLDGWGGDMDWIHSIVSDAIEQHWEDVIVALLVQEKIDPNSQYFASSLMELGIYFNCPATLLAALRAGGDPNKREMYRGAPYPISVLESVSRDAGLTWDERTKRSFRYAFLRGGVPPELCPFPDLSNADLDSRIVERASNQHSADLVALDSFDVFVRFLMANMPDTMVLELTKIMVTYLSCFELTALVRPLQPPKKDDQERQQEVPAPGNIIVVIEPMNQKLVRQPTVVEYSFNSRGGIAYYSKKGRCCINLFWLLNFPLPLWERVAEGRVRGRQWQ